MVENINDFIAKESEKYYNEVIDIRRKIHMNPELGDEEFETSMYVKKYLEDLGYECDVLIKTGIVAELDNRTNENKKVVATRADMDALPIHEENKTIYKSQVNGKMHACGHDVHVAIQLVVAKILSENKDKWNGYLKFIFQPAEETCGGALRMIEDGVLDNPKPDVIFSLHAAPEIEVGKIGIKYGQMHASSDMIEMTIHGKSSHGAIPQNGVDAIVIGSKVIDFLQLVVSRKISPLEEAVITIGSFHGGEVGNIICDMVEMKGTIRTLSQDMRNQVLNIIQTKLPNFVEALDGKIDINIIRGYDAVVNNNEIVKQVEENIKNILGDNSIKLIEKPRMDVEDFSYYLQEVKGAFFRLGVKNDNKGIVNELHHPRFDIDEESLKIGIQVQLKNILEFIK